MIFLEAPLRASSQHVEYRRDRMGPSTEEGTGQQPLDLGPDRFRGQRGKGNQYRYNSFWQR